MATSVKYKKYHTEKDIPAEVLYDDDRLREWCYNQLKIEEPDVILMIQNGETIIPTHGGIIYLASFMK